MILVALVFSITTLSACLTNLLTYLNRPEEKELSFETVIQTIECPHPLQRELRLVMVSSPEELVKIRDLVSKDVYTTLEQIDFQQDHIVGLFRGLQPTYSNDVVIERVTRRADAWVVYAEFGEPGFDNVAGREGIFPCHVIKVAHGGDTSPLLRIELVSRTVHR